MDADDARFLWTPLRELEALVFVVWWAWAGWGADHAARPPWHMYLSRYYHAHHRARAKQACVDAGPRWVGHAMRWLDVRGVARAAGHTPYDVSELADIVADGVRMRNAVEFAALERAAVAANAGTYDVVDWATRVAQTAPTER